MRNGHGKRATRKQLTPARDKLTDEMAAERAARIEELSGPTCACGHRRIVHGRTGCLASVTRAARTDGKRVVGDCDCTGFMEVAA